MFENQLKAIFHCYKSDNNIWLLYYRNTMPFTSSRLINTGAPKFYELLLSVSEHWFSCNDGVTSSCRIAQIYNMSSLVSYSQKNKEALKVHDETLKF